LLFASVLKRKADFELDFELFNTRISLQSLRANPYKNQTKSQMSGKAQKIKFALLLHGGSP